MRKSILFAIILGTAAISLTGCGRKISETAVPSDLATYLYTSTPDDGIDQTKNLGIDAVVGKETKNKEDGTISVPIEATVTDRSIYTGQFEVIYEKTEEPGDEDGWKIKDVKYIDRDSWTITPVAPLDVDGVKLAIIDKGKMIFAGAPTTLNADNITNVALSNFQSSEDETEVSTDATFDVVQEIVTYHVEAELKFIHTINGYKITESNIKNYEVELNDAYTFTVSDEDLMHMLENSAMRVGVQSVDLANVTEILEREDEFDPNAISMTIITKMAIENKFYRASANIYFVYKLDSKKEYWQLSSYTADNFKVEEWFKLNGLFEGKIGNTNTDCDIVDSKSDGSFTAMLVYKDKTEMEMNGKIDPESLEVSMQEEDGTLKLKGVFSADIEAFKGQYGKKSTWWFQTEAGREKRSSVSDNSVKKDRHSMDTDDYSPAEGYEDESVSANKAKKASKTEKEDDIVPEKTTGTKQQERVREDDVVSSSDNTEVIRSNDSDSNNSSGDVETVDNGITEIP